jgi:hypothetical protein
MSSSWKGQSEHENPDSVKPLAFTSSDILCQWKITIKRKASITTFRASALKTSPYKGKFDQGQQNIDFIASGRHRRRHWFCLKLVTPPDESCGTQVSISLQSRMMRVTYLSGTIVKDPSSDLRVWVDQRTLPQKLYILQHPVINGQPFETTCWKHFICYSFNSVRVFGKDLEVLNDLVWVGVEVATISVFDQYKMTSPKILGDEDASDKLRTGRRGCAITFSRKEKKVDLSSTHTSPPPLRMIVVSKSARPSCFCGLSTTSLDPYAVYSSRNRTYLRRQSIHVTISD